MPPKKRIPKSGAGKGAGTTTHSNNPSVKKGSPSSSATSLRSSKVSPGQDSAAPSFDQDSDYQLMLEVMWCVQEIDALRTAKKTSPKQAEELQKVMRSLLNNKTALIKKRQLMRAYCGDYRQKMLKEDHMNKREEAKIQENPVLPKKSLFIRKVASNKTQDQEQAANLEHVAHNLESLEISDSDTAINDGTTPSEITKLASLFKEKSSEPFQFKFPVSNTT